MIDPRTSVINDRLSGIGRIVAVSSGKGGVGKSLIATILTLTLAERGYKVGLLDLDFTSPSTHIILGVERVKPKEEKGLVPQLVHGLKYMSLIYFSGDRPAPLRGADVSNALIELLSITIWDKLDFLVIDMPPGIGDAVLDLLRLLKRLEFLMVTTPSILAFETLKKQVSLLSDLKVPIIGVVENMKINEAKYIEKETGKLGLKFLVTIPFDAKVEDAIGCKSELLKTSIAKGVKKVIEQAVLEVRDR